MRRSARKRDRMDKINMINKMRFADNEQSTIQPENDNSSYWHCGN